MDRGYDIVRVADLPPGVRSIIGPDRVAYVSRELYEARERARGVVEPVAAPSRSRSRSRAQRCASK